MHVQYYIVYCNTYTVYCIILLYCILVGVLINKQSLLITHTYIFHSMMFTFSSFNFITLKYNLYLNSVPKQTSFFGTSFRILKKSYNIRLFYDKQCIHLDYNILFYFNKYTTRMKSWCRIYRIFYNSVQLGKVY